MPNRPHIRVAIIDDDADFLKLAETHLKAAALARFEVSCFQQPMAIYDIHPLTRFDAYVVDYKMDPVDGVDLIRGLRGSIHPGPFILCSGVMDDIRRRRAQEAGIELVLEKSNTTPAELAAHILAVIEKAPA